MKLYIAADHAGQALKAQLRIKNEELRTAEDLTPVLVKGDDYPLVAKKLASKLLNRRTSHVARPTEDTGRKMGILICGSGVGVCIAANRNKGIRAAVGHNAAEVKLAREHNDINVLCLSGWETKPEEAIKMIKVFLETKASKAERHARRRKELN